METNRDHSVVLESASKYCISDSFVDCDEYSISSKGFLIAKFRLKVNKVGKTSRPFRCVLNQIPYDYTMEVQNIYKGLDMIDRMPDELWMEVHDIVQETGIKTIPKIKKCK